MAAYTAREAAERLRVHRTTVLRWNSRGWIDPDGERRYLNPLPELDPTTGATLFDWDELLTAEQQTRAKSQRSHRASRQLVAA